MAIPTRFAPVVFMACMIADGFAQEIAEVGEPSVQAATPPVPHAWQRWEHALTSTRDYGNPYADVTLSVSYTGPGGLALRCFGFWDGGDTFRIRCAFPAAGTWQWETQCSDPTNAGLHQQRGAVEVSAWRWRTFPIMTRSKWTCPDFPPRLRAAGLIRCAVAMSPRSVALTITAFAASLR